MLASLDRVRILAPARSLDGRQFARQRAAVLFDQLCFCAPDAAADEKRDLGEALRHTVQRRARDHQDPERGEQSQQRYRRPCCEQPLQRRGDRESDEPA